MLIYRGEPLLHKEIIDFIQYAKNAQVADQLVMFTNGALLTKELAEKLGNCGLDFIQISVEGVNAEKYQEVTGCRIDYDKLLENIRILYRKKSPDTVLHTKIVNCGLSDSEKGKFYHDFSEISVVNYDGMVVGCSCGDWRNVLLMGNVLKENFYDIWNGKKYQEFRKAQLKGERRRYLSCSDCKMIQNQIDDIDIYRTDLIKKFE